MEKQQVETLKRILANKQQCIGIIVHTNPDGDAIGSSLGLYRFLKVFDYPDVHVIAPNDYASFLHWIPGNDQVTVATKNEDKAQQVIAGAGILFCLDFNGFGRTEQLANALSDSKAVKVMIDHHPQPEDGFDIVFSDTNASSTAELVYELITSIHDEDAIDTLTAQCIYAGIVTDTGSFSYGCNNPRTYEIVARLIEKGVDGEKIHRLLFSKYTESRMRLLGYCLSERLVVMPEFQAAYIHLTKKDLATYNYITGDTEGVVNYAMNIEGIRLAALFTEEDDHVKVSLRSTGSMDVNLLARQHFNGGGHKNAAGGKSFQDMNNTLRAFVSLVKKGI